MVEEHRGRGPSCGGFDPWLRIYHNNIRVFMVTQLYNVPFHLPHLEFIARQFVLL